MRDREDLRAWLVPAPAEAALGRLLTWATWLAGAAFAVSVVAARAGAARTDLASGAAAVGSAVLLAAPFLATLVAAVAFARRRAWVETGLAALLLTMLCLGAWIGGL